MSLFSTRNPGRGVQRLHFRKLLICTALIFLAQTTLADVQYKVLEVEGYGPNVNAAVYDALEEAIGRVNGKSIETVSMLSSIENSVQKNEQSDYFASDTFQKQVQSVTKGVVSSYELLASVQTDQGWRVRVRAKIAKYNRTATSTRKRLAVIPFKGSSNEYRLYGKLVDRQDLLRIFTQHLVSELVQSRRFTILDREFIEENLSEKRMITQGDIPTEELVKLGQELVADYIVVGVLERLEMVDRTYTMQATGRQIQTQSGLVEASCRLIDVATRQVSFSDLLRLPVSEGDIRALRGTPGADEGDATLLSLAAAGAISKKVLNAIYPIIVVKVQGEIVTLGQGGDAIQPGMRYEIYQYGERIIDPNNKETLGREEIYCGEIEITRATSKMSYAKLISSVLDLEVEFAPKKFICRESAQNETARDKEAEREERIDRRKQSLDGDW